MASTEWERIGALSWSRKLTAQETEVSQSHNQEVAQ